MSTSSLLVPSLEQMLNSLSSWLTKAESQQAEADALLTARLAPDMFPLATQVRFACVQAYEAVSRLKGEALPVMVNELLEDGRNAGEQPGTLADAQARITATLSMLEALAPDALDVEPGRELVHELPNGMIFDFTAEQYIRDWVLPQFYFHVMTAYAILRSEGIQLGKADYVAHLFPFIRPETLPKI